MIDGKIILRSISSKFGRCFSQLIVIMILRREIMSFGILMWCQDRFW